MSRIKLSESEIGCHTSEENFKLTFNNRKFLKNKLSVEVEMFKILSQKNQPRAVIKLR